MFSDYQLVASNLCLGCFECSNLVVDINKYQQTSQQNSSSYFTKSMCVSSSLVSSYRTNDEYNRAAVPTCTSTFYMQNNLNYCRNLYCVYSVNTFEQISICYLVLLFSVRSLCPFPIVFLCLQQKINRNETSAWANTKLVVVLYLYQIN